MKAMTTNIGPDEPRGTTNRDERSTFGNMSRVDREVQCTATITALQRHRIAYSVVDVSLDDTARDYVLGLGYLQVPVVTTDTDHWAGFRPDRITALTSTAA